MGKIVREDYVKIVAKRLSATRAKIEKLKAKDADISTMSQKAYSKYQSDLNWQFMHLHMDMERIGFALGYLSMDDLRETYSLSGFHTTKGVKEELSNIEFV